MNADKRRYNAANLRSFAFICGLINYMKIIFMQPCPPTAATPLPLAAACMQNNRAQAVGFCIQARRGLIYCACDDGERDITLLSGTLQSLTHAGLTTGFHPAPARHQGEYNYMCKESTNI